MIFPAELDMSDEELHLPFSETTKLCILFLSVALLLLALGILLWQTIRCYLNTRQDPEASSLPDASTELRTYYTHPPNYTMEARRWSSQLSLGWPPLATESGDEALQEKVQGSLLFSLYYDRLQSQLVVTVLQAKGLRGRGPGQKLHPFVWVRLLRAGPAEEGGRRLQRVEHEWQSRAVKDSLSPSFGDQFTCSLEHKELAHTTVRLEVRDFDAFSRHESMGEVRVPLGQLNITSYPLEQLKDLQPPQKDLVGDVFLSLRFLPTCQRLEVGLLKIRTLPPPPNTHRVLNVRVSVQCNQGQLRHHKTPAQAHAEWTVFNQVLPFALPDPDLRQCSVLLSVYQSQEGRKSTRRLLGHMTLGKGAGFQDLHWNLMMRSVRQPVAQWHQLLI